MSSIPSGAVSPGRRRRRVSRRAWVVAGLGTLAVLVAGTLLGLVLWLRSYTPIGYTGGVSSPGPATLDMVLVRGGPGGKTRIAVSGRKPGYFTVAFDLTNSAPFGVRVDGPVARGPDDRSAPVKLLVGAAAHPARWSAFVPFELHPGETRKVGVMTTVPPGYGCGKAWAWGTESTATSVSLRFSFLRVFRRQAFIELPIAASVVCGKLPAGTPIRAHSDR